MRAGKFKAACVQMCSGRDVDRNIADVCDLVSLAAARGAQFVTTPEMTGIMETDSERLLQIAVPQDQDRCLKALGKLARDKQIWINVGSLAIRSDTGRLVNRSVLIDNTGATIASYDKIHMFDAMLANGETYRESATYAPGAKMVMAPTPWGMLGMSICYDLRFPDLYRHMAQKGCVMVSVPSAFTRPTGKAHWHVLLRARAIETGSFVFAAAQCGEHESGRETYGHSLVVSPWGEILADGGGEPGVVMADIDMNEVNMARSKIPSLGHDREFNR